MRCQHHTVQIHLPDMNTEWEKTDTEYLLGVFVREEEGGGGGEEGETERGKGKGRRKKKKKTSTEIEIRTVFGDDWEEAWGGFLGW